MTMKTSISRVAVPYKQVLDGSDAVLNNGVAMLIADLFEETTAGGWISGRGIGRRPRGASINESNYQFG